MQYKVLTSIWFSPPSVIGLPIFVNIGIVVIETNEGFQKAYIGYGTGLEQPMDEQIIAANGQKFPVKMAKAFWPQYNFIT